MAEPAVLAAQHTNEDFAAFELWLSTRPRGSSLSGDDTRELFDAMQVPSQRRGILFRMAANRGLIFKVGYAGSQSAARRGGSQHQWEVA